MAIAAGHTLTVDEARRVAVRATLSAQARPDDQHAAVHAQIADLASRLGLAVADHPHEP